MANYSADMTGFEHESAAGCCCVCCAAGEQDATGISIERLEELISLAAEGSAALEAVIRALAERFGYDAPSFDGQQASRKSVAYDAERNDADQPVDGLISGSAWATTSLTFSFTDSAGDYSDTNAAYHADNWYELSGTVQTAARAALLSYEAFAPLTFTELTGSNDWDADLRFAGDAGTGTAYAWYPSSNPTGGDSYYGTGVDNPLVGTWDYHTLLHEIGHAMGLKHGHDDGRGGGAIPLEFDSMEYSVMTYRSYEGAPLTGYTVSNGDYAQSLMMLDIAAIQRMYGANFGHEAGDTVYTFSTTTGRMYVNGVDVIAAAGLNKTGHDTIFRTIWDGNGTDTYDFSNFTTNLDVDLAPGAHVDLDVGGNDQRAALHYNGSQWAAGHVYNAMLHEGDTRSLIENARGGAGDDRFSGNAADNTFWGNAGNDVFADSAGSDTYHGGSGTDRVEFFAPFTSLSFETSGSFIQVIGDAIDWVADTVELIAFGSDVWSFADLWEVAGSGGATNTPPVANDDERSVAEDGSIVIGVLGNDSDTDGDALSVTLLTAPANGSAEVLAGGSIRYVPDADFHGTDTLTYQIDDGKGGTATATVTVTVTAENDAPVAGADSASTLEGEAVTVAVLDNDSDVDGDALSVSAVTDGANGTTVVNGDGTITYTPAGGFFGQDSFTYTVIDGKGGSHQAIVSVTVTEQNDAPVANDDARTTAEDTAFYIGVLGNDSDPDGDTLAVTLLTGPSNGSAEVMPGGSIYYVPDADFSGTDTLTYRIDDGKGGSDTAMVTVTVTPVNDAPDAVDDSAATGAGETVVIDVLANDGDRDGGTLSIDSVGAATNGTVMVNPDGTLSYTPDAGFSGQDSFSYLLSDGQGGFSEATVTVDVAAAPPPVLPQNVIIGFEGLAKGSIPDMEGLSFEGAKVQGTTALNGSRAAITGRDGVMTITALGEDFDFNGALFRSTRGDAQIQIEAWDDGVLVGTATVFADSRSAGDFDFDFNSIDMLVIDASRKIRIDDLDVTVYDSAGAASGNQPEAGDDSAVVAEGGTASGNVLTNDSDGGDLHVAGFGDGKGTGMRVLKSGATVVLNEDGSYEYDPNGAFDHLRGGEEAEDGFSYMVADGAGGFDVATVTLTIEGEGEGPAEVIVGFEHGLFEDGFVFADAVLTNRAKGVMEGGKAARSADDIIVITGDGAFDFEGGWFTAVRGKRAVLELEGYADGELVATESVRITSRRETEVDVSDLGFDGIDTLHIISSRGVIADELNFLV